MCAVRLVVDTFSSVVIYPSPLVPVILYECNLMAILLRYALVIHIVNIVFYYLLTRICGVRYFVSFRACLVGLVVSD